MPGNPGNPPEYAVRKGSAISFRIGPKPAGCGQSSLYTGKKGQENKRDYRYNPVLHSESFISKIHRSQTVTTSK